VRLTNWFLRKLSIAVLELRVVGAQIVPSFVSSLFTVRYSHVTRGQGNIPEDRRHIDELPLGEEVIRIIHREVPVNDRRPHENRVPSSTPRRRNVDVMFGNDSFVGIAQALQSVRVIGTPHTLDKSVVLILGLLDC